jgi:hypothetical protein
VVGGGLVGSGASVAAGWQAPSTKAAKINMLINMCIFFMVNFLLQRNFYGRNGNDLWDVGL